MQRDSAEDPFECHYEFALIGTDSYIAEQGPCERSVPVNHDSSRLAEPVGACLCLQISVRIPALVAVRDQTHTLSFPVNVFVPLTTISQLGIQLATSQINSHRSLQHQLIGQP